MTKVKKTNAQKQREYRARRDSNPQRRAEYLEKERTTWATKRAEKKWQPMSSLSEREKRVRRRKIETHKHVSGIGSPCYHWLQLARHQQHHQHQSKILAPAQFVNLSEPFNLLLLCVLLCYLSVGHALKPVISYLSGLSY